MHNLHNRKVDRTPESNTCFVSAQIRRWLCERHDPGEHQPHRADSVPGWSSRITGLAGFLGVVLVLAALTMAAQGQTSVTLAWNPAAGTNIAGYKIYYGVASRTYTNTNNVGNATNATISSLINGTVYYFAATAYDTSGLESDYSTEVVYTNQASSVATIWPTTAVPGTVDGWPDTAVELGVQFRSDVAGSITGIRFYKATANTGTHLGHLWGTTGTLLASATFTGESASGWQQVNFGTPVAIAANTVYVASYYATVGHYSADTNYFSSNGVDRPPLHALANGVSGGNGVYAYGASSAFPNQSWNAANYWVDVVFQSGAAPTLTSIAVTPANPTLLVGATQQFTATGTYSDGSTQNLTNRATWASSSPAVATVNATGLAAAISAGTTTVSATLNGVSGSSTPTVAANPPTIALTAPVNGASYTAPAAIGLAATVAANGHTITKVQFYNGATLLGAVAAVPYSFSWANVSAGSYSLTAQAVYDSGSTAASAPVNVTCVNTSSVATIWPTTAVPGTVDGWPDTAVELGVQFRSDVAGSITGIRFYKATANTGTHLGHLWSTAGTLLASATFTGESASGWQQVNFGTPVAIAANTVYVASYYATVGHYSADTNYFSSNGVDRPPLHALANGVSGGNGVYAYGASSAFPNQTWNAANYWVDVVFQSGAAPTLTSIAVTPANPALLVGATKQFTATGTYSDGSTQNLTNRATWASSSPAVATVNATGLAAAVSAGTTTVSATLNGVIGNSTPTVTVNPPAIALTAPVNGASYTAPAAISLAATVAANGHTITKVQFYNGATLIGQVTTAPFNLTWTNVSAGSYSLSASLVYDAGSTLASSLVNIVVTGLPAPWQTTDLGSVGVAGSAGMSNSLYTVQGAGNISGTADNFRFVYQPMSGDGDIKVRLNSVGTNAANSCIGVMIRESITAGSRYTFMGVGQTVKFRWQSRSTTAGNTSTTTSVLGTTPNVWARLTRTGNTLAGYRSTDGTNWTQVNSRSITMATNIYVGLAVASGSANTLNTATFTTMTVVP